MIALFVCLMGLAVLVYIGLICLIAAKLQDWTYGTLHFRYPVLIPWVFCMFFLIVLPTAILIQIMGVK